MKAHLYGYKHDKNALKIIVPILLLATFFCGHAPQ